MGSGMARNLLRAGHTLTVYNRTRERAQELQNEGAQGADTPRAAANGAEVVISMVADDGASRAVWLGDNGALAAIPPGALLIESSTLSPGWVRELAAQAHARRADFLDAPVIGSKPQAAAGELGFFIGGDSAAVARAMPLLAAMGKQFHHLGAAGSGAMMKLINNLIGGVEQVVLAEAMALAERSGLDLEQVAELVANGPVASSLMKRKMPVVLAHDYDPAFMLEWMHKDMTYALAEGARATVPMPTVAAARELMRLGMARGWGKRDAMVVYELLRPEKM